MAPLRTELSTVSMPPRERILGKRRAKAIKNRQPVPPRGTVGPKPSAKTPAPTLAATRTRRLAALDVAYLDRPDGFHIKRVIRRPPTPENAPPIPYLPSQDDIPRSDTDSDEESDNGTISTVPEIAYPLGIPDANVGTYITPISTQPEDEDMDYDAAGETDDDFAEDYPDPSYPLANFAPLDTTQTPAQPNPIPQTGFNPSDINLIAGASEDDLRALFNGLDRFPVEFPNNLSDNFPVNNPANPPVTVNAWDFNSNMQGPGNFGMHQLHAVVNDLQADGSPGQHNQAREGSASLGLWANSHSHLTPTIGDLPLTTPSRALTPTSAIEPPFGSPARSFCFPLSHPAIHPTPLSRTGTPTNLSGLVRGTASAVSSPRLRLNVRSIVAEARAHRTPLITTPQPRSLDDIRAESLMLLRRPPLRRSLELPDFLQDDEGDKDLSYEDQSRSPTPVAFGDTDIGLNEFSPAPVTQARARAIRYANVRVLPRHSFPGSSRMPTVFDLELNALKVLKVGRRRNRRRRSTTTESARKRNILSSSSLSRDQQTVITQMEYHVTKDILFKAPWPEVDGRDEYLADAVQYSTVKTGVSGDDVFSQIFLDTVYYRAPGNRGSSLRKIEYMMETEFDVASIQKPSIFELMNKDQFLYPNKDRNPNEYFCVSALGSALEIILFKSSKLVGVVFMEELCKADDPEGCAHWHRKLRDRSARRGVPPGLLAFAATQMYWALEKLYMGATLNFDEQHYRSVWDRYFRALLKLPHLGRLRVDMLDRLKKYYMVHWPAAEPDDDEESFPAW